MAKKDYSKLSASTINTLCYGHRLDNIPEHLVIEILRRSTVDHTYVGWLPRVDSSGALFILSEHTKSILEKSLIERDIKKIKKDIADVMDSDD